MAEPSVSRGSLQRPFPSPPGPPQMELAGSRALLKQRKNLSLLGLQLLLKAIEPVCKIVPMSQ